MHTFYEKSYSIYIFPSVYNYKYYEGEILILCPYSVFPDTALVFLRPVVKNQSITFASFRPSYPPPPVYTFLRCFILFIYRFFNLLKKIYIYLFIAFSLQKIVRGPGGGVMYGRPSPLELNGL